MRFEFIRNLIESRGAVVPKNVHDSEMLACFNDHKSLTDKNIDLTQLLVDAVTFLKKHEPTRGDRRRAHHDSLVERIENHLRRTQGMHL
jgi:hypothetical protein